MHTFPRNESSKFVEMLSKGCLEMPLKNENRHTHKKKEYALASPHKNYDIPINDLTA